jgi:hypothetical protein
MLAALCIGAVGARAQQSLAPFPAPQAVNNLTPSEIALYEFAPTLIDWTPQQIRDFPSLHKLQSAASQDQLPMILDRAGQTGAAAFQDFPQISCDEAVTSEIGSPPKTKHQNFRYIVLPRPAGDVQVFDEYRTDPAGNPSDKLSLTNLFMITSGFAGTWLYLSPDERHDSRFRYFGTQTMRNRECYVVGFAQDPEKARNVGEFTIGEKSGAVLVQGLAWIDTKTFQILRVMTWLLAAREDLGLSSQISTVDFYAVQPAGSERTLWLPRDVKVWVLYSGTAARNTHQYSNFKLFRVESTIKP